MKANKTKFADFDLHPDVINGIESMGYKYPSLIQQKAIPVIMQKKDLIACAQTGTGKTAAFLIPVINDIIRNPSVHINTLVIVPTRELTVQIDQQLQGIGYFASISSKPVYGGGDGRGWELEKSALTKGCNIIIGTPGKLLQHLLMGYVKIDNLKHLILDEADRMLDMGFYDDIIRIIKYLPQKRQNLLFSATMPPQIRQLAKKILYKPVEINISVSKPAEGVIQAAYFVSDNNKNILLRSILDNQEIRSVLIFASTKQSVKQLEKELSQIGAFRVRAMHSDLCQSEREKTLLGFKNREFETLVATDILSRGIDIDKIDIVVNYNVPSDPEDYVHRIGRTARAESSGLAITLINNRESGSFKRIERFIGNEVYKLNLPPLIEEKENTRQKSFMRKKTNRLHNKSRQSKRNY